MSPQADYVVSNGTGAAVRSDINGQLAAIVSNNSGATAPSTTYAYMLWADTTTGLLKLRNGANSAWITVGDLTAANLGLATLASPTFTGTATIPTLTVSSSAGIPLGSAASPTLFFTGDTNTGLYSPGADQVALSTGGTGRLFINSSGSVGIGTSSPKEVVDSRGALVISGDNATSNNAFGTAEGILLSTGTGVGRITAISNGNNNVDLSLRALNAGAATEGIRIKNDGKVGIGTTSPTNAKLVVTDGAQVTAAANDANATCLTMDYSSGVGRLMGHGSSGGQLAFFTNASGSGVSERARIDSSGRLLVGTSTSPSIGGHSQYGKFSSVGNTSSSTGAGIVNIGRGTASSSVIAADTHLGSLCYTDSVGAEFARIEAYADAASGTNDYPGRLVFSTTADGASSPTERMRITSNGVTKISNNGSYASTTDNTHEITTNQSGNSVVHITSSNASFGADVIVGGCLRSGNSAYKLLGLYSGDNSSSRFNDVEFNLRGDGNGYCDGSWTGGGADYAEYFEWSDGNPDEEDRRGISVVLDGEKIRPAETGEDPIGVISGNPSVVGDAAWNKWTGKYLRDDYGSYILKEDGERQLNPAYDPDVEYVSREDRPEWDCVGLMGKLRIRKGQPTGSRWIKMRDISDSVEEWLVR